MTKHKKIFMILMFVALLCILGGCQTSHDLRTNESDSFKSRIMSSFKQIESLDMSYDHSSMYFTFKVSKDTKEDVIFKILENTKPLFTSSKFQSEYKDKYNDAVKGQEYRYPSARVNIILDENNKDSMYIFDSAHDLFLKGGEKDVDNYNTWTYRIGAYGESHPVPTPKP